MGGENMGKSNIKYLLIKMFKPANPLQSKRLETSEYQALCTGFHIDNFYKKTCGLYFKNYFCLSKKDINNINKL